MSTNTETKGDKPLTTTAAAEKEVVTPAKKEEKKEPTMAEIAASFRGKTDGTGVVQWDPYLAPYATVLRNRYAHFKYVLSKIDESEGGLEHFAEGYRYFGFNRGERDGVRGIFFREWAPGAHGMRLFGEFNDWDRQGVPCTRLEYGRWECFLPDRADGQPAIAHGSRLKLMVETAPGHWEDRVPAWITRVVQHGSPIFDGVYWCPPQPYKWQHAAPARPSDLRIYECHIGMSSEQPKISTYSEFARDVVPYICELGYNAVQIMAVMEHGYYSSFGYQVSNFFAVSSRFGTPEELKALIDTCHARGLVVLLDIVHSHASKNVADGLNMFDGTDSHLFHAPPRGVHSIWDSRLFNYGNWETMRFLLSNVRWYLDEYRFDGFRFDGVTSMLYVHHGIGDHVFDYNCIFGGEVDHDALCYLTLANELIHRVRPGAVSIAEDVSGFPCLCRPTAEGGVGFDYRLHMACPDLWVSLLKKTRDEDWNMGHIAYTLNNRRFMEPCIAYAESHDQALVGDKTIAFWLMDKEMYTNMSNFTERTLVIDRGLALHKMIRLITCTLGGEGYLTFMGNEFGHPEWIDFPRPGNGDSYQHARRQWGLVRDHLLRYKYLYRFDHAMMCLEEALRWLPTPPAYVSVKNEGDKIIVFERAGMLCVFNFHPTKSFTDYRVPVRSPGKYVIALDSDDPYFGGHGCVSHDSAFFTEPYAFMGFPQSMMLYIPSRTALILVPAETWEAKAPAPELMYPPEEEH